MRLALYARGGADIGVGHLVRCLAVAQEARARGWTVSITPRVGVGWLHTEFAAIGVVEYAELPPADVVLIDSYTTVPDTGSALVVAVRDGDFGPRTADITVDANLEPGPATLRGPEYAMLRATVLAARERRLARWSPADPPRVAVSMGGSDLGGPVVSELVTRMRGIPLRGTVFGALELAEPQWTVLAPTPDLPERIAETELFISAAGTTLLEACCIGVPLALVCLADNQKSGYAAAVSRGLAFGLGEPGALADPGMLLTAGLGDIADKARATVDGRGCARLLDAVLDYGT